jgi:hypothetical protein
MTSATGLGMEEKTAANLSRQFCDRRGLIIKQHATILATSLQKLTDRLARNVKILRFTTKSKPKAQCIFFSRLTVLVRYRHVTTN